MPRAPRPGSGGAELLERFAMADRADHHRAGLLHRSAQAGRPGPGPAARPRGAVPRRAHLRASTRPPPARSSTSSAPSPPSTAAPSCSAPTSSARPAGWPTGWPCSTAAGCGRSARPTSWPPTLLPGLAGRARPRRARRRRGSSTPSPRSPGVLGGRVRRRRACASWPTTARSLARVVAGLVGRGGPRATPPCPSRPSLEDVYFEIQAPARRPTPTGRWRDRSLRSTPPDWRAIRAVHRPRTCSAVRRSKAVVCPMLLVPVLLLVVLPVRASASPPAPRSRPDLGELPRRRSPTRSPRQLPTLPDERAARGAGQRLPAGAAVPHRPADGLGRAGRRRLRRREGAPHARGAAAPARSPTATSSSPSCSPRSCRPWPSRGSASSPSPSSPTASAWPVMHRVFVPDPAVGRDDPVGGAGGGALGPRRHGAGVGPGQDDPGGEPARRRRDPAADLPRRRPGDRAAARRPAGRHRHRRRASGSSPSGSSPEAPGRSPRDAPAPTGGCDADIGRRQSREDDELDDGGDEDGEQQQAEGDGGGGSHRSPPRPQLDRRS